MSDIYKKLAKYLDDMPGGFPATESGVELRILRRLFTPEEAELALSLTLLPEEPAHVARRIHLPEEETARRFLSIINSETDRLVKLVDDLLDLSLLESKRVTLDPKPVDVGGLVTHTVDKLRPIAAHSQLTLVQSAPPGIVVFADADRLEQVLTNLVDNALKYTPPGGRVEVQVAAVNGEVEVVVNDTGKGIRPEDLPHVFERFYRSDRSRTRGSGGTGLGLAIAKHIVEAHGGRISVSSRPNEGTTFTVTIPMSSGAVM